MIDTAGFETAFVIYGATLAVLVAAAVAIVVGVVRRDRTVLAQDGRGEITGAPATVPVRERHDDRADDRTREPVH